MQRLFAFDPGTAALGWAVMDCEAGNPAIVACGVRHYALTRQKIVERMKVRLKPEQRAVARDRRRMRLKKLHGALLAAGIVDADGPEHWKRGDGSELNGWLECAKSGALPREALARIIFNVHRHRGSRHYGPAALLPKVFLEDLLSTQSKWHPQIAPDEIRSKIVSAVFHRRTSSAGEYSRPPVSPLAILASKQLKAVWHGLAAEFGAPDVTVFEGALPYRGKACRPDPGEAAMRMLHASGLAADPRSLRKARLFLRQSDGLTMARCALTGADISFETAMTSAVEVDHRLPRARGGGGGRSNLQLALAEANRVKGAGNILLNKTIRNPAGFADADALRQSLRMLKVDFAAMSPVREVNFIPPAKVLSMRQSLAVSLNKKDRSNLRHHALDAIVTGMAWLGGKHGELPAVWPATIEPALAKARFSVQTERSTRGRMHDDTRYGLPSPASGFDPGSHVAARRPVESLTPAMKARIADPGLRQRAISKSATNQTAGSEFIGRARRVKVAHPASGLIRIPDDKGWFRAAVLPADNHHMDIVQMRDGRWKAYAATRHARAQYGWRPDWETCPSGGKLVMRLHKGDLVEWRDDDGSRQLLFVARLNGTSGIIHFIRPWAASASDRLVAVSAGTLKKRQAKAVEAKPAGTPAYRRSNAAS